ncbi:TonB-dependent receptor [Novosphingobium decolorationis]|uniref:TonB-dependent receptor n=1 Tax=Novosphingobium decolorationis TaxID=2698673 RepID=A0ABX8E768_9SPHN|nr:TonB-dependent receptor [Novosphingobium decolorationis]QVM84879.1 TonB-dependent receptor [Novosphingobium decolorationis]
MRLAVAASLAAMAALVASPADARTRDFAIPAGALGDALNAWSAQSGVQVLSAPETLEGRRSQGAHGRMSQTDALERILVGTGLIAQRRAGAVLIRPRATASARTGAAARTPSSAAPAYAPPPLTGDPIHVIGLRMSERRARAAKREARVIADAISSDEVRRLPDTSVVDAMRRIPGISVIPIADNEHPRDVPVAPVVRGLMQTYNNVTVNGLAIASTGIPEAGVNSASRGVRLDILPTALVSELVVLKTFTPERDPNAIGGAIDIRTRSALARGGAPFASLEAGLTRPSRHGEVQPQSTPGLHASGTFATTFGPERRFGLVLSADTRRLQNNSDMHGTSDSGFLAFYAADGTRVDEDDPRAQGRPVPVQDKYWINSSDRRRHGLSARFEADLPDLAISTFLGSFTFRDGFIRNEVVIEPRGAITRTSDTSGYFARGAVQVGYRDGVTRTTTRLALFDATWSPTDKDRISVRGARTRATMDEDYTMVKFTSGRDAEGEVTGSAAFPVTYDTSALHHSFTVPRASYTNLALYPAAYWRERARRAVSDLDTARLDWRRNMAPGDSGLGLAAGAGVQRARYHYRYANAAWSTDNRDLTLAQAGEVRTNSLPYNRAGLELIVIDPDRAWAQFAANQEDIALTSDIGDALRDRFDHAETSLSAYAMTRLARGPWELVGGLHLDRTSLLTQGYIEAGDTWTATTASSRYTRLLPAFLANFDPTPSLRLRAGYSRTLGRPSYESYAPRAAIDFGSSSLAGNPQSPDVTVRLGNPGLAPRTSDNFDVSAEWILPARLDGLVSAALFHKRIRDEIFDALTQGYTWEGVYYSSAQVIRPVNASAAHISGLELSASVGSLGALSHHLAPFGFTANWTRLDGAMSVLQTSGSQRVVDRLVGQPSQIGNVSLFYAQDGLELRAAINATGRALRAVAPDAPSQDVYWAPRRQVDLQARYHFAPRWSVVLDVSNLTQARLTSLTGPGHGWLKDSYAVPRSVRLSLHWGLGG